MLHLSTPDPRPSFWSAVNNCYGHGNLFYRYRYLYTSRYRYRYLNSKNIFLVFLFYTFPTWLKLLNWIAIMESIYLSDIWKGENSLCESAFLKYSREHTLLIPLASHGLFIIPHTRLTQRSSQDQFEVQICNKWNFKLFSTFCKIK